MTALETIAQARRNGVSLSRASGRLRYAAPAGRMTPTLKQALLDKKTEILDLLEREERGQGLPPPRLAAVAARVYLWRVPGDPVKHIVTGPDHDLRDQHPDAIPLFYGAHRDRMRDSDQRCPISPTGDGSWKRELRALLEQVYPDDDGTVCEELCNAEADPEGALRCYRDIATNLQRKRGDQL